MYSACSVLTRRRLGGGGGGGGGRNLPCIPATRTCGAPAGSPALVDWSPPLLVCMPFTPFVFSVPFPSHACHAGLAATTDTCVYALPPFPSPAYLPHMDTYLCVCVGGGLPLVWVPWPCPLCSCSHLTCPTLPAHSHCPHPFVLPGDHAPYHLFCPYPAWSLGGRMTGLPLPQLPCRGRYTYL